MPSGTSMKLIEWQVQRLYKTPAILLKTEIEFLHNVIYSDYANRLLLEGVFQREEKNIGQHATLFVNRNISDSQRGLQFLHNREQRVAFCYQFLENLVSTPREPEEVWYIIKEISAQCSDFRASLPRKAAVELFIELFITPILDYLKFKEYAEDFARATMIRYKQRIEWFGATRLQEIAKKPKPRSGSTQAFNDIERRLKQDFYQYLFDQGLDFTIDPKSPKEKGKPDVITAKLNNERRLIVEAKVYDGQARDENWIKSGISQAASYADEWNEPYAFLLVYNAAHNTVLEFAGASHNINAWTTKAMGKEIRIICINLYNELTASKAKNLEIIKIDIRS